MSGTTLLYLLQVGALFVIGGYGWSSFALFVFGSRLPDRAREIALDIRMELKPFMLPAVLAEHFAETMLGAG